jgi:hypothetical protein
VLVFGCRKRAFSGKQAVLGRNQLMTQVSGEIVGVKRSWSDTMTKHKSAGH